MQRNLRNTPTSTRSHLRELHKKEPRQHMLDETRIDYRRTIAGCIAVILLLGAGVIVGRCSAPAAAQEPQTAPTLDAAVGAGYDFTDNAGRALVELDAFLTSITTTTTRRSAAAPQAGPATPATPSGDRWDQLAICESGGRWDYPPVSGGFSGGIMFHIGTWLANGGGDYAPDAYLASREQQIVIAERVLAASGWGAWPGCSRKFGWL